MLENGYILLHRKLVNWEWYKNVNTKILFLHLLLTVNYEDKKFEGLVVKRGSRIASKITLAKECGLTEQSIKTAIKHLKSTGELTTELTNGQHGRCTVFTVVNYDAYQAYQPTEQPNNQPTSNQSLTNAQPMPNHNGIKINKYNKANNINKYIYKATEKFENQELTDKIIAISDYRKKIKKPFTEQAVDLFIKKLMDLEPTDINKQIAIVNQTIERGWLTVYPLKEEAKNNGSNIRADNNTEKRYGNYI